MVQEFIITREQVADLIVLLSKATALTSKLNNACLTHLELSHPEKRFYEEEELPKVNSILSGGQTQIDILKQLPQAPVVKDITIIREQCKLFGMMEALYYQKHQQSISINNEAEFQWAKNNL